MHQNNNYTATDGTLWRLYEVNPPIPSSKFNWAFLAENYDGAPDSKDKRFGFAQTREKAIEEIEQYILDNTA